MGLAADAGRPVDELSEGQLRRVAIAAMVAHRPRVLVLDEPLAGLDAPSRQGLLRLLRELRDELGMSVVVASHDLDGVDGLCDRLVRLDHGQVVADHRLDNPTNASHGSPQPLENQAPLIDVLPSEVDRKLRHARTSKRGQSASQLLLRKATSRDSDT